MTERSAAAGYVIIVVLESFGGWGATRSYNFACLPEPRKGRFMSGASQSDYYGGGGKKEKSVQTVRKCNEHRG